MDQHTTKPTTNRSTVKFIRSTLVITLAILFLVYLAGILLQSRVLQDTISVPPILAKYGLGQSLFEINKRRLINYTMMAGSLKLVSVAGLIALATTGLIGKIWNLISTHAMPGSSSMQKTSIFIIAWYILEMLVSYFSRALIGKSGKVPLRIYEEQAMLMGKAVIAIGFCQLLKRLKKINVFTMVAITACIFTSLIASLGLLLALYALPQLKYEPRLDPLFQLTDAEGLPRENIKLWENVENAGYGCDLFGTEIMVIGSSFIDPEVLPIKELTAIVGHELGHRYYKDSISKIMTRIVTSIAQYAVAIFVVLDSPTIYSAFGFATEPVIGAIPISEIFMNILDLLLIQPLSNGYSLYVESRADIYSAKKGFGSDLIKSLNRVSPLMVFHKISEYLYLDHPSNENRANNIEEHKLQ